MHRVHHSIHKEEMNQNFGFNVPLWDRLFGTYLPQPQEGHTNMSIGLNQYRVPERLGIFSLLRLPFKRPKKSEI